MENDFRWIIDNPRKLSFKFIKEITDCLSEERKLGNGAFGQVYKGVLEDGEEIAVKMLNFVSGISDQQFRNEFEILKRLNHPHIVRLLGFCDEEEDTVAWHEGKLVKCVKIHRALCLEFVPNGNLGDLLSRQLLGMNWSVRYKIIKGICEGLKYLHEGLEEPIMHFDLKLNNILLDGKMVPKIADFGLSRLLGEENTKITLTPLGTLGYWPPEFITNQIISKEYDIFSLGVIMTKIITGNMEYSSIVDMEASEFIEHVHDIWRVRLQEIPGHASLEADCKQVKRCIEIAINCMDKERQKRPKIKDIVSKLDEIENTENNLGWQIEKFDDPESAILSTTNTQERTCSRKGGTQGWPSEGATSKASGHIYKDKEDDPILTPRDLTFQFLEEITYAFSDALKIGSGSYGTVYKALLNNEKEIAVKKLYNLPGIDDKAFLNECRNLKRLHHRNIVELVGYCYEVRHRYVEWDGKLVFAQVPESAICFEYIQNGSLEDYLSDEFCGLDWQTRYKIIVGICEGLNYLHNGLEGGALYHLDLKPANILLDKNMEPKIADFGLSRLVAMSNTHVTSTILGTLGYLPPEYIDGGIISNKFDIFSLGIIIIKIISGFNGYSKFCEMFGEEFNILVTGNWMKRLGTTLEDTSVQVYCEQVKKCMKIAVKCVESDRHKRPSIGDIVLMLNKTETLIHKKCDHRLLYVHPQRLCFHFEPKRLPTCTVRLHNSGDGLVAFRLLSNNPRRYLMKFPPHGFLPPRCTYTLVLTMRKPTQQSTSHSGDDTFTLQSVAAGVEDIEKIGLESTIAKFFEDAGDAVHEMKLRPDCDLPAEQADSKPTRPEIEIISMPNAKEVLSIEVHPTEAWIMTTHRAGNLRVWNYQTMAIIESIEVTDEQVCAANFVAREKWIVAGDSNGDIHVYNYEEGQDVTSYEAHDSSIVSLAVHPTDPYVLSSSLDDSLIKLWNYQKGWECTRTFQGSNSNRVTQITFNPEETSSFTSVYSDGTVKIWSLCSNECQIITALDDHQDSLLCAYVVGGLWKHLITGFKDGTTQIWDMETKECVQKLKGHADHLSAVFCHPEYPNIITGSLDGTIGIWDSLRHRLENIICCNLGAVYAIEYIIRIRRVVIGCDRGIATIDIDSW